MTRCTISTISRLSVIRRALSYRDAKMRRIPSCALFINNLLFDEISARRDGTSRRFRFQSAHASPMAPAEPINVLPSADESDHIRPLSRRDDGIATACHTPCHFKLLNSHLAAYHPRIFLISTAMLLMTMKCNAACGCGAIACGAK